MIDRRATLRQILERLAIKAPADGLIYGSTVFALNAVIRAVEPIMFVVPQCQKLVISTRIATVDVDQVSIRQLPTLRFSIFDARKIPELSGEVIQIHPATSWCPRRVMTALMI